MSVEAVCGSCDDVHPLSDRWSSGPTTACPSCGSKSYETVHTGEPIRKSESERIRDAMSGVDGVGKRNRENVVERYTTLAELEAADVDELVSIDGIGKKSARGIRDAVRPRVGSFEFVGDAA